MKVFWYKSDLETCSCLFQGTSYSGGSSLIIFHPFTAKVIWYCRYVCSHKLHLLFGKTFEIISQQCLIELLPNASCITFTRCTVSWYGFNTLTMCVCLVCVAQVFVHMSSWVTGPLGPQGRWQRVSPSHCKTLEVRSHTSSVLIPTYRHFLSFRMTFLGLWIIFVWMYNMCSCVRLSSCLKSQHMVVLVNVSVYTPQPCPVTCTSSSTSFL